MRQNGWKRLAITSPGPACGKTMITVNLAFSLARQAEMTALYDGIKRRVGDTAFLGYETTSAPGRIRAIVRDATEYDDWYVLQRDMQVDGGITPVQEQDVLRVRTRAARAIQAVFDAFDFGGVSDGEVQAAIPLVRAIMRRFPDHPILVTTVTPTGARRVEAAFGDAGIRVHRSHWVLLDAVTRLRQSGNGWLVELVDGHKLPVSRRKRREVSERLGRDFVREDVGGASG